MRDYFVTIPRPVAHMMTFDVVRDAMPKSMEAVKLRFEGGEHNPLMAWKPYGQYVWTFKPRFPAFDCVTDGFLLFSAARRYAFRVVVSTSMTEPTHFKTAYDFARDDYPEILDAFVACIDTTGASDRAVHHAFAGQSTPSGALHLPLDHVDVGAGTITALVSARTGSEEAPSETTVPARVKVASSAS